MEVQEAGRRSEESLLAQGANRPGDSAASFGGEVRERRMFASAAKPERGGNLLQVQEEGQREAIQESQPLQAASLVTESFLNGGYWKP
jgi:hypothetical protein